MAFLFDEENTLEWWLEPCSSWLTGYGYKDQKHTNTRVFWNTYWQLLDLGFTEQQIVDHTIAWRYYLNGVSFDLAMTAAVQDLAKEWGLCSQYLTAA